MIRIHIARRRRLDGEEGFALLTVMGAMLVITLFLLSTLGYALKESQPARADQDSKAALATAQAGIDEFLARLNANDTYWTNDGNDCNNLALVQTTRAGVPACSPAKPARGVAVPGAADSGTTYKYQILSSVTETSSTGLIRLKATGYSRNKTRDLIVQLSPVGFLKYIYFTDIEASDPAVYRTRATATARRVSDGRLFSYTPPAEWVDQDCAQHYYNDPLTGDAGRANNVRRTTISGTVYDVYGYCSEIQFTSGDQILGPLKTNDALQVNGSALFAETAPETGWKDGYSPAPRADARWWGTGTPSDGTAAQPGFKPIYAPTLQIPDSNAGLIPAASGSEGCLYFGQTRIRFDGDKMKVLSPSSKDATKTRSGCYDTARSNTEQTVDVPSVIYVDDATTCGNLLSTSNAIGDYPMSGESVVEGRTLVYRCTSGNAFVQGTLDDRVTIGTRNDIVITGDTTYTGGMTGDDALGLIPQNNAWIYHPVNSSGDNLLGTPVRKLDAAVLSVKHSFLVQNWAYGASLSPNSTADVKLRVRGAIAQKFRGPVGTGNGTGGASTGYLKDYQYDDRLLSAPPPYFLKPVTSPWVVQKTSD